MEDRADSVDLRLRIPAPRQGAFFSRHCDFQKLLTVFEMEVKTPCPSEYSDSKK